MQQDIRREFLKALQNEIKRHRRDIRYLKSLLKNIGSKNLPSDQVKGIKHKIKEHYKGIERLINCTTIVRRYTREKKKAKK